MNPLECNWVHFRQVQAKKNVGVNRSTPLGLLGQLQ
jgi:hypothetical protein